MDLIVNTNLLKHLTHMLDRSKPTEPIVEGMMSKPLCPMNLPNRMPLPRKSPEETGYSSADLSAFFAEVIAEPTLSLHGILIVRDGAVICDASFGAYRSDLYHVGHSLSKSVTATAIGLLIDEGRLSLDDRVVRLLEKRLPPFAQLTYKNLTVRHLLTMTSGASFSEAGAMVETHWLRAYFESLVRFEPGKQFAYNSMNSYVLAALVREVSGLPMREYLKRRLFDPMGITLWHWETSPEGIEAGGWGLYLCREDTAKLGLLYLNGGLWQGKRLLSERWVKQAVTASVSTPESCGDFDYGFHIWVGRTHRSFLFNGMFGQDMLAFRDSRTLIVTNGSLEQIFQQSVYYEILARYFASASDRSLPKNPQAAKRLARQLSTLKAEERLPSVSAPLPAWLKAVLGVTYRYRNPSNDEIIRTDLRNGTGNLSLLPFLEQMLRNRYAKGLRSFTVTRNGKRLVLHAVEGDTELLVPFFPNRTVRSVVRISETDYHTAVTASLAKDEDGRGVIKLQIDFPEIASTRFLKLYFDGESMEVRMTERPGLGLSAHFISAVEELLRGRKRVADLVSRLDPNLLFYKLEQTLEPSFRFWRTP